MLSTTNINFTLTSTIYITYMQDSSIKLLREESKVLSRAKRSLEQHHQTVKQHLQSLDGIRRSLKTKASSLSRTLELDAQNLKVGFLFRQYGYMYPISNGALFKYPVGIPFKGIPVIY